MKCKGLKNVENYCIRIENLEVTICDLQFSQNGSSLKENRAYGEGADETVRIAETETKSRNQLERKKK